MQSIGIADKVTLDLIKLDTNQILTNTANNSSFDWREYENFNNTGELTGNQGSLLTFQTVLDVSGEGFLSKATLMGLHQYTNFHVKVTIDGAVVVNTTLLKGGNQYRSLGYSVVDFIMIGEALLGGVTSFALGIGDGLAYPVSGKDKHVPFDVANGVSLGYSLFPLVFNESCKVEMAVEGGINVVGKYEVIGGIRI